MPTVTVTRFEAPLDDCYGLLTDAEQWAQGQPDRIEKLAAAWKAFAAVAWENGRQGTLRHQPMVFYDCDNDGPAFFFKEDNNGTSYTVHWGADLPADQCLVDTEKVAVLHA